MSDDFGDVGDFETPELNPEIIEAISSLVIDESFVSNDRVAEDIDNLIEAIGMERMQVLKDYLMRDNVVEQVCDDASFRDAVERRIESYRLALNSIDFSDTGDL